MNGQTTIEVLNLHHGCAIKAFPESGTHTYFLPVAGVLGRGREVRGYLVSNPQDPTAVPPVVYVGTPHLSGTNWWLGFSRLPPVDPPAEYFLVVSEQADHIVQKLSVAVRFRVKAPLFAVAAPVPPAAVDYTIRFDPQPPSVLCPQQFRISGTYVNPSLISGSISSNPASPGSLIYYDNASGAWVLQFTNVPPSEGNTYTLTATANDPANPNNPASAFVTNLAVALSGCNSIPPSGGGA